MTADPTTMAVVGAAAMTGIVHALIPDHWLPFVLIGRARNWSLRSVALVAGFSGMIHAAISVGLALIALAIGIGAARAMALGENLEHAGAWALVALGLAYAIWAWRKGGHFHPGGARLHAEPEGDACSGGEGPAHPDHLHYHADDAWISGSRWSLAGLALLVGINPCVLITPIVLAGVAIDRMTALTAAAAYSVTAVTTTVVLSMIGVGATRRLWVPGAARYMEAASGLLIAALGAGMLLFGH